MKTRQSCRRAPRVSHSRWLAYATAGAATALAGSNSAEGAIHYSGLVNEVFPPHVDKIKTFQLDQPGDYFTLSHHSSAAEVRIVGIASAGAREFEYIDIFCASKLHRGQTISSASFGRNSAFMAINCDFGTWTDPGIGFIGFGFNSGAGTQHGWARVGMAGCDRNNGFKLIDYAYADPGERIRAGQGIPRGGEDGQDMSDEQGPAEGSLGWLAVGAVGLLAWRKSRSRTARLEDA
jgi:hypothetical protein